jgi:hypothetical protein
MAASSEIKAKKSKKKTILIEAPDDFDPFGGVKKLLGGFCDPHSNADDATIVSIRSTPDLGSQAVQKKEVVVEKEVEKNLAYGLNNNSDDSRPDPTSVHGNKKVVGREEFKEETKSRELPELKATHTGSKLRARRGIEVTIFAFVAVLGTLCALHRLGYQRNSIISVMDSQIVSEPKGLINIVYNDKVVEKVVEDIPVVPLTAEAEAKPHDTSERAKELMQELEDLVAEIVQAKVI